MVTMDMDGIFTMLFSAGLGVFISYVFFCEPHIPPPQWSPLNPATVGKMCSARRSIFPKDFQKNAQIPREAVLRALEAANWAPTHGKTEPWRFVVFEGAAGVEKFLAMKRSAIEVQTDLSDAKREAMRAKASRKEKELRKCAYIIAVCVKRLKTSGGELMPMWEEIAATSCAVQNLHLALWAEKAYGYWSSGGYKGWLDVPSVRALLKMDGTCDGEADDVLGFFFVGAATDETVSGYRAKRGPIADKLTWY